MKCDACQKKSSKLKLYFGALPLRTLTIEAPFQEWGMEFIGKFTKISSGGHRWILMATNYFTKWVESIPIWKETRKKIMNFVIENFCIRSRTPTKLVV